MSSRADRILDEVRMYTEEKLTIREIADRVGRCKSTVRNDLLLAEVTFRTGWPRTPKTRVRKPAEKPSWTTEPAGLPEAQQALARDRMRVIGQMFREERIAQGLMQAEVAHRAGVSPSVLSRLELGHRGYPPLVYMALGVVLGVRLSDIFRAAEERVPLAVVEPEATSGE